jgi:DNA polymerase-3 subunit epsilon
MRQIILDTETTGLEPAQGHRIIEIGCVELVNRRPTGNNYHQYINPGREIEDGAFAVHGISNETLADKPDFGGIAADLVNYLRGAELIIHNAPFDVGFLNHELGLLGSAAPAARIEDCCTVLDTLRLARELRPGQKNDLDSLCRHYGVDNSQRTLHGARLDAEILTDVYLAMTGGQTALFLDSADPARPAAAAAPRRLDPDRPRLPVIAADGDELAAHAVWLEELDSKSGGNCLWMKLAAAGDGGRAGD